METRAKLLGLGLLTCMVACSRQSAEQFSPRVSPSNSTVSKDRVLDYYPSAIRNNYSHIDYAKLNVERLKPVLKDQDGNILNADSELKTNSLYKITVECQQLQDVQIQTEDGFDVISTTTNGGQTIFTIKTSLEVPKKLYVSFVPLLKGQGVGKSGMGRLVRSSPQNFFLPN